MNAVVHGLGRRLALAETDRVGALLDLLARHQERGKHAAAVSVGMEAVEACAGNPRRRSDALVALARSFRAVEAFDLASEVAARAIHDAVVSEDPAREARARELQGTLLTRRGHYRIARQEFRIAGLRHRTARDTLAMKRTARLIADTYRLQGIAAQGSGRPEHAEINFRQAMRAYRVALATGEFAAEDASICAGAADCESRRGNFGLARIQVDRALALAARVEDPATVAEIHLAECRLLRCTGDLRAAEWAGERACAAARALRDDTLGRALQSLAAVHDAQGRFERASDVESQGRELLLGRHRELSQLRAELSSLWDRENNRGQTPIKLMA